MKTERKFQDECIEACKRYDIYCLHIRNEDGTANRRSIGMRKGVPDLLLIGNTVMFVELKRDERLKPSDAQSKFHETLRANHVPVRTCGSMAQFMKCVSDVRKPKRSSAIGISFGLDTYKSIKSHLQKVSKYYLDRESSVRDVNSLFAIRLFSDQKDRQFPWLCNAEEHCFIATGTSKVTARLLLCGWDVVII